MLMEGERERMMEVLWWMDRIEWEADRGTMLAVGPLLFLRRYFSEQGKSISIERMWGWDQLGPHD